MGIQVNFIGAVVPCLIAVLIFPKLVKHSRLLDWLLIVLGSGITYSQISVDCEGVKMMEFYAFIVVFYVGLLRETAHVLPTEKPMPAMTQFSAMFFSMVFADVQGAYDSLSITNMPCLHNKHPIVGGLGWKDGLVLWPMGASLVTLGLAAAKYWGRVKVDNSATWPNFFRYHFRPF